MKKVGNILLDILIVLVVLLALTMSVMVISSKASGVPNVLGYSPVSVLTDSMEPTFSVGDLIIIKKVDTEKLKVGDVVTYKEVINNVEILNTHRIIEIYVDDGGLTNYITQGDNVPQRDIMPVYADQIVGKWTEQTVPFIGKILDFVKTQTGIMLCFVVPLALLFLWQLYKFIMLLAENKKQKAVDEVTGNLEEEKQRAVEEYIAQQKAQAEAEQKAKQNIPPPPQEETENPKLGQESAPAEEIEETQADETETNPTTAPAETEETEMNPPTAPVESEETETNPTTAPAVPLPLTREVKEESSDSAETDETEMNPTTAPAVPLPLTREVKEESSAPMESEETPDVGNDPCVVPDDETDETEINPTAPVETEETEMNPTTAPAVPLPLTREAKEESSAPMETDETPDVGNDPCVVPDEETDGVPQDEPANEPTANDPAEKAPAMPEKPQKNNP